FTRPLYFTHHPRVSTLRLKHQKQSTQLKNPPPPVSTLLFHVSTIHSFPCQHFLVTIHKTTLDQSTTNPLSAHQPQSNSNWRQLITKNIIYRTSGRDTSPQHPLENAAFPWKEEIFQ